MSLYFEILGAILLAVLGWLAGMLTFQRSERWCRACGETLRCVVCARRSTT